MDLSRYATLFLTESREQLGNCGQALLEWERHPEGAEPVVVLFRAMHTFKGMAAAMGYTNLTLLAHQSENLLDRFKADPVAGRPSIDLFFRIVDALERALEPAVAGQDGALEFAPLLEELEQATGILPETGTHAVPAAVAGPAAGAGRDVSFVVSDGASMRGARALIALRKAEALGQLNAVRPPLAALEVDGFDGRVDFHLVTTATDPEIVAAVQAAGEIAEVTVGQRDEAAGAERGSRGRQIRIDLTRLDAIVNLVSELVVAKARLGDLADHSDSPELRAVGTRIGRIASELYGEVIEARLTPVWQVFDRFPRVVRDLARRLGRRVHLEMEGTETRLDRAILDELGEPLIHLLRNAVDHGIEPPEERSRRGKPEEGLIRLTASGDRTTVIIRVSDDGAGIDRERIRRSAVEKGYLAPDAEVTDDTVLRILEGTGLSTASAVSDVSGRGMGVGAAAARVRALGGALEVSSIAGAGTTFTLRLPMTLAIVRALLAQIGEERYAIPVTGVLETVEYHPDRVRELDGREAFQLRDLVVPTVRLRERLGVTGARPPGRLPAVIVAVGERRAAVVVDALVGQQEIVVEPFDAPRGTLAVFRGATILGDGAPALIVDPAALV